MEAITNNELIDSYWVEEIQEDVLIKNRKLLYEHNKEKLIKNNTYTTVVQQQCGKIKLLVVDQVIHM